MNAFLGLTEAGEYTVVLEVALQPNSCASKSTVHEWATELLQPGRPFQAPEAGMEHCPPQSDSFGSEHVYDARVHDVIKPAADAPAPLFWQARVQVHAQVLHDSPPAPLPFSQSSINVTEQHMPDEDHSSMTSACSIEQLPSVRLHKLWPSLCFADDDMLKARLMSYSSAGLALTHAGVDGTVVRWNRLVLLHGPPGTGKTSLCRALSSKLALLQSDWFSNGGVLLELSAHNVFSRWFSESSKHVTQVFEQVQHIASSDPSQLVCVLIDEIESLAHARRTANASSEPSDALRTVNAVLTRLDALRERSNVFLLATSNATEAVDDAFVDRADLKAYVGPPDTQARHCILKTCVEELLRTGIVHEDNVQECSSHSCCPNDDTTLAMKGATHTGNLHSLVATAALESNGMSGRALRRLPFLAAAECRLGASNSTVSVSTFIHALRTALQKEHRDRDHLPATD